MARPKTPTAVKKLRGTIRKDRTSKNEPKPRKKPGGLQPPAWLSRRAKAEWRRLAPELERIGLLTIADLRQFARYCDACAHFEELTKRLNIGDLVVAVGRNGYRQQVAEVALQQKYGEIVGKLAARFGLDPSSRASLDVMVHFLPAAEDDADKAKGRSVLERRLKAVS